MMKKYPKYKNSGIKWLGKIPKHWVVKKMHHICHVRQGLQIERTKRYTEPGNNRFEYITIKSINNPANPKEYIANPSRNVICTESNILVGRTGATGTIVTGYKGVFHNNFFLVNYDSKKVDKEFLFYYLNHNRLHEHFILLAGTTTVPDLNHDAFLNTVFIEPSLNEQKNIANFLNYKTNLIDTLIEQKEKQIQFLKEYRTALISQVVTGKIDIS